MQAYIAALRKLSATGVATEHTFRGSLETLVNTLDKRFMAVNEPKRQACGAPDYVVLKNTANSMPLSVGYIEAKDIWVSLDKIEGTDQFKRYIVSLDNLILTNYLEFRRFVRGEQVESVVLGKFTKGKNLEVYSDKANELQSLLHDFLNFPIVSVASARELAVCMAKLTHAIREIVLSTLDSPYKDSLEAWREAFARTLIPDLMQENRKADFADMYAQTIAYGFFAARCHHDASKGEFARQNAQDDIPKTNPLLRSLFVNLTGPDLKDEPYFQFVEDLVQLLALADMWNVLKDFGERDKRNDPVIHFYETFLSAYDPELREKRGIYYTPEPVVSWLVRSADVVVRQKFSIPEGLADNTHKLKANKNDGTSYELPKVLILDPSCGTGTFLYQVIELIRERLVEQKQIGMWSAFVRENLLPRIFGFELLMAPYAVAHFKLSLQLAGYDMPGAGHNPWAYDFSSSDRLRIFLTNTLEEMERGIQMNLPGAMKVLSDEGQAAREVKTNLPVLVIMGNPPYSGESANSSIIRVPTGKYRRGGIPVLKTVRTLIGGLIEDYKQIDGVTIGEANPKWLQDDYVKFIRWAQWKLENVAEGVVTFVTNHGYLDNPTFRGMRWSLLRAFDEIYVYDLHGNTRKKEKMPDGSVDENVFDIQQGVAMLILVKRKDGDRKALARVWHAEMYGTRRDKYKHLFETDIANTTWEELAPIAPGYLFIPQDTNLLAEYNKGISITTIFPVHSLGIATARDMFAVRFSEDEIWNTVNEFINLPVEEARHKFDLGRDARDWKVFLAQEDVRRTGPDKKRIQKILYRPFDVRYTYYTGKSRGFMCMPRFDVMRHFICMDNIGMSTSRGVEGNAAWSHIFCSKTIIQLHTVSLKEVNYFFPLYVEDNYNIAQSFIDRIQKKIGNFEAINIFYYVYAILHVPQYINRYVQFLRADFPKILIPQNEDFFSRLSHFGKQLIGYHTLTHLNLSNFGKWITQYPHSGNNEIASTYPTYANNMVFINPAQCFSGVPEEVWHYTIVGYQPAEKWLKDRKGRNLSLEEIQTYQKIILALAETIRIRKEMDAVWKA